MIEDPADQPNANMMITIEGATSTLYWRCMDGGPNRPRCRQVATHRALWPGAKDWLKLCAHHLEGPRGIATAMGFHLQDEPLPAIGVHRERDELATLHPDLLEVDE